MKLKKFLVVAMLLLIGIAGIGVVCFAGDLPHDAKSWKFNVSHDDNYNVPTMESYFNYLNHSGYLYSGSSMTLALTAGASVTYTIDVADKKDICLNYMIECSSPSNWGGTGDAPSLYVQLYETSTIKVNGSTVTLYNMDRTSSLTAGSTIYVNSTITTAGTGTIFQGVTRGFSPISGANPMLKDSFWKLKKGLSYLIVIVNQTVRSVRLNTQFCIIEEE